MKLPLQMVSLSALHQISCIVLRVGTMTRRRFQTVTFWSPIVGGDEQPSRKGHVFTISKGQELPGRLLVSEITDQLI